MIITNVGIKQKEQKNERAMVGRGCGREKTNKRKRGRFVVPKYSKKKKTRKKKQERKEETYTNVNNCRRL
jgi:hypothetical protein